METNENQEVEGPKVSLVDNEGNDITPSANDTDQNDGQNTDTDTTDDSAVDNSNEDNSNDDSSQEDNSQENSTIELTDEIVLSFLKEKTGRDINSYDELIEVKEVELDEDVKALQDYIKDNPGRGLGDYMKLQQDFTKIPENDLLKMYYSDTMTGLDSEDIIFKLTEEFGYDEDDDESVKRSKDVNKKLAVAKAVAHFEEGKKKYKAPLESREMPIPEDQKEAYNQFLNYQKTAEDNQKQANVRRDHFTKVTENLFSKDFEGFEFTVGDGKKVTYKVEDVDKVKGFQMSGQNFVQSHLDENNLLKDAGSYHKQMFAATNADAIANFFYELGQTEAIENHEKGSKNINMKPRNTGAVPTSEDGKVKYVSTADSRASKGKQTIKKR